MVPGTVWTLATVYFPLLTVASTVQPGSRSILYSDSGPTNLPPAFTFLGGGGEAIEKMSPTKAAALKGRYNDGISLSCDDDIFENGMETKSRFLPYRIMDKYRSERVRKSVPTLDLVDGDFRARITPQWGGKVFAFEHTPSGRDLLHTPSVHQPIIASVRNAQVDGGIEWNYSPSILGHWAGTQDHVWAAKLKTSKGDGLQFCVGAVNA